MSSGLGKEVFIVEPRESSERSGGGEVGVSGPWYNTECNKGVGDGMMTDMVVAGIAPFCTRS